MNTNKPNMCLNLWQALPEKKVIWSHTLFASFPSLLCRLQNTHYLIPFQETQFVNTSFSRVSSFLLLFLSAPSCPSTVASARPPRSQTVHGSNHNIQYHDRWYLPSDCLLLRILLQSIWRLDPTFQWYAQWISRSDRAPKREPTYHKQKRGIVYYRIQR